MKKRIFAAFCSLALVCGGVTAFHSGAVEEPFEPYSYDSWDEAVPSQAGYIPDRVVYGEDIGAGSFDSPSDIFFADDGLFYIADTKNDRIVAVDEELSRTVKIYDSFTMPDGSVTSLKAPKGVYVSPYNGLIYIADSENERILAADKSSNAVMEIKAPEDRMYTAPTFKPQRILADKAGNIYAVLGNITTGSAMFAPDGSFMGYYGANRVQPTAEVIGDYLRSIFMSEEKRSRRTRSVPSGITSFDIDGDFIFTCTASSTQRTDTVKKLNAAGKNIFADVSTVFGDRVPVYDPIQNTVFAPSIIDIDIAEDGCINCLDLTSGRIFQYDEECSLLFITGAKSGQLGGVNTPSALESHGERLYILDSVKDSITVYKETVFGRNVHEATRLYNDGYYEEALEPWFEVLRHDGNYRRANIGVASALLRKGDYKGAMKYARIADSPEIYNKAFEGWREEFIKRHFTEIFFTLFAVIAALTAIGAYRKKRRKRLNGREEHPDAGAEAE